ncbi:Ribonuclease R [Jannaschia seosinensis]|uniref:Ribonuclease R n=1 Tax=Jannaschia seosinensis TaxID=313367 RepID=A0A0M7B4P8_9RHOB|nr:ribonuclease R [Jannaschia seosinensis]CUH15997.1 Ribonuclease R [Jannaschia seosinensis]
MSQLPTKADILQWIADNPALTSKRDVAKAFGIKGAARIDLKRLLKELEAEGHLTKRKRSYDDPNRLPPVSVLRVVGTDPDGDLFLAPHDWQGDEPEPRILFIPKEGDPALAEGDRVLARLTEVEDEDHSHEGRLIRRLSTGPRKVLGIFRRTSEGGRIEPIDKGVDREWLVPSGATGDARDGELVEAEQSGPKGRMGLPKAKVVTRLGDPGAAKAVSLIAIHQHGLRDEFPDDAIAEAEAAEPPVLGERTDLRDLPLVTIDPSDARDHDDACYAHADDDPKNPGGHVIWVAIADVAAYVTPGSALDREALLRGNSTYFPDRVVPMLPDALSGDLCSLHEGVERACIAVRMRVTEDGRLIEALFHRGLMRSPASLHYEEVQAAFDGDPNDRTAPLLDDVIRPLYAAYGALRRARAAREPLDLDLPERRIELSETGEVTSVAFKDRLDAHRLIEEFMILANVATAEELIARRVPLLFRVHEEPEADRIESLRETAQASGFSLPKGQVLRTAALNRLLRDAAGTELSELISMSTLRAMQQAYYAPVHLGHFGLALRSYAHFTSPIRRYADLVVHRALITAHGWGPDPAKDGLSESEIELLDATAKAISEAERRSMVAERDTNDRYLAAFLADQVGAEFTGRISGVQAFGVFVKLDETGADGLIPVRSLGAEYFRYDRDAQVLTGTESGTEIGLGQRVTVRLAEAVPVTGGLTLELLSIEGERMRPKGRGRGRPSGASKPKKGKLRKAPGRGRAKRR